MALEPITRQEKIIAGQDLTPITRMEMFLKNFGGGGGGSVPKPLTYDYMPEGYPKKSGWSIEWDGNTDGLVSAGIFYKVSDMVPTDDELIGTTAVLSTGKNIEVSSAKITAISEDITAIDGGEIGVIVRKDNATMGDTLFPQKGTYFPAAGDFYVAGLSAPTITMAEEFLPAIPADKLPSFPFVTLDKSLRDTIANPSPPQYNFTNLTFDELYDAVSKEPILIRDTSAITYMPFKNEIFNGNILLSIIIKANQEDFLVDLCCNNGTTNFFRNNIKKITTSDI